MGSVTAPILEDQLVQRRFVRPFRTISNRDVAWVGGKNASLGEMYCNLAPLGIRIPNGFAVTADAYREALTQAGLWKPLHEALDSLDPGNLVDFAARAAAAAQIVREAQLPRDVCDQIVMGYHELEAQYGDGVAVAVRSSATAEDLPSASFAGQHESFLNVRGDAMVLQAYRSCLASLFTERAIHYRLDQGFDHFKVALSVGIMKMVRSDLACSGVAFTLDTETGFRDVVFITGSYGLGENVVQGNVDPDEFYVHKSTYQLGYRAVLRRNLGKKAIRLVLARGGNLHATTQNEATPPEDRQKFCLSDAEVLELAGGCIAIERHYSELASHPVPMDVEWAKDGADGSIYFVQARPETAASRRKANVVDEYQLDTAAAPLTSGRAVGTAVAAGAVRIVRGNDDLAAFRPGEVLVAQSTTPDWEPVMKSAAAIVTDHGGRTCHAAIVARELGIPAVVGTSNATSALACIGDVTVSCAQGEEGRVYRGRIAFERREVDVGELPVPPVKLMLTLADPQSAFARSFLPNAGVGLVRIEFIASDEIQAHPMALLHPERVRDRETAAKLCELASNDASGGEYFVRKLAEGVGTIAAAFYPKPVVVRMSDFKSNEYAKLLGGADFEPEEANPMLGLRGAARYTHPMYAEAFALECAAMNRVRDVMGLRNVILMIPFCRRTDEARRVVERMAELGLKRSEDLQIYVMCEIPNNVVQIDAFSRYFDGFSIGSNDLTQLVLGVDRDSDLVAADFDERDPGVLEMLRQAVAGAHRNGRYVGICGQAPSDYPEVAKFLVDLRIDSISLNPDSVISTLRRLAEK
jgi:pyruvate, water dikinase